MIQDPRTDARPAAPPLLSVLEAARVLGIGRTTAYALIREGVWPTPVVRLGRLIRIPAAPLRRFVETGRAETPHIA